MNGRFFLRVVLALVVVAAIVGIGAYVYNAGVSQGLAQGAQAAGRESGAAPYPYYVPYVQPVFGFGFFGLLVPLFFLFLLFGAMRALFWRGAWGRMHGHGPWDKGGPAMFEEWHRRQHEPKPEPGGEPQTQK